MNKAEYMNELAKALEGFDADTRNEIIDDYESHFAEAQALGIEEEMVIRELGSVDELINELKLTVKEGTGVAIAHEAPQEEYYGFNGEHYIDGAVISGHTIEIVTAKSQDDMFHLFYQELGDDVELYQEEKDGILYAGVKRATGFLKNNTARKFFNSILRIKPKENENMNAFSGNSKNALAPIDGMDFGPGKKIIVLVPAGMKMLTLNTATSNINVSGINCENLELNTITASVKVADIECRNLNVKNVSGHLELTRVNAENLKAKNVSGSIKSELISGQSCEQETVSGSITSEFSFPSFKTKTTSGTVYVGIHNEINEGSVSCISGSCHMKLYDEENLTADVSSTSGHIGIDMGSGHVTGKGTHTFGNGKAKISVRTVSGSINISK